MSNLSTSVPMGNGTAVAVSEETGKTITVDAKTGDPTLKPTGKVLAAAVTTGALVVAVAVLTAITPDLLGFLGKWAPVGFAGVVALAGFLAGYIKRP